MNNVKEKLLIDLKEELEDDHYECFMEKAKIELDMDKMTLKISINATQKQNNVFTQEI